MAFLSPGSAGGTSWRHSAPDFHVAAVDLRGYGQSSKPQVHVKQYCIQL